MTSTISLAKELKQRAQALYQAFSEEGNLPRAVHMKVLFDAAERVRFALEDEGGAPVTPAVWVAIREIEVVGYPDAENYQANDQRAIPLYRLFLELKASYEATRRAA